MDSHSSGDFQGGKNHLHHSLRVAVADGVGVMQPF